MARVPGNSILKYGYAKHGKIRFSHYGGVYLPAIQDYITKFRDWAGDQPMECSSGYWDGDTFVIENGRHRYIALLILGHQEFLVRWYEQRNDKAI